MYIGLKNGKIVAFSQKLDDLKLNATIKRIVFDTIEETDEEVVPYYNTHNDGIYFKQSQVPPPSVDIANAAIRTRREELYRQMSDPLTNEISVLKDEIEHGLYSGEEEDEARQKLIELFLQRQAVRQQIVSDHPYVTEAT